MHVCFALPVFPGLSKVSSTKEKLGREKKQMRERKKKEEEIQRRRKIRRGKRQEKGRRNKGKKKGSKEEEGAAATAPIRPLAWEPPYTSGVALKRKRQEFPLWCSGNKSDWYP